VCEVATRSLPKTVKGRSKSKKGRGKGGVKKRKSKSSPNRKILTGPTGPKKKKKIKKTKVNRHLNYRTSILLGDEGKNAKNKRGRGV